jgi:hypothetical protein
MTTVHRTRKPVKRRDATGHLDPRYAADLRLRSLEYAPRPEEAIAFVAPTRSRSSEGLAEVLGEEFVETVTTGEEAYLERLNQRGPEDEGGPFVVTRARDEFARGSDPSNPEDATREPFPTALGRPNSDDE